MLRALVVLCWLGGIAVAADPPAPTKWVTDNVSFLSPAASSALDEQLRNYEARTHHQVIVWIGAALEGNEPIDDFAARVFKAWGIGRKHADDGVALFVIPATHDTRIEVGYGLEPQLADLAASHILTETVVPELRAGHADAAIQKGVDQILAKLDASGAELQATPGDTSSGLTWWEIILLVIGGIALLAFAITHPNVAWFLIDIIQVFAGGRGGSFGGGSSSGGGGGGFSGGGGSSGGGGASAKW